MKNLVNVIVGVAVGLVILILSFYGGVLLQTKKTAPQIQILTNLQSLLQSKTLQNSEVYLGGMVTKISGENITLTVKNESLEVPVSKDAKIIAFVYPDKPEEGKALVPQQKNIAFEDVKVGDEVSANVKIKPDGQFEAVGVRVLPKLPQ